MFKVRLRLLSSHFLKIENDEVNVKIVHGAVGAVSESDVMLAEASKAIIVAFNTVLTKLQLIMQSVTELKLNNTILFMMLLKILKELCAE